MDGRLLKLVQSDTLLTRHPRLLVGTFRHALIHFFEECFQVGAIHKSAPSDTNDAKPGLLPSEESRTGTNTQISEVGFRHWDFDSLFDSFFCPAYHAHVSFG